MSTENLSHAQHWDKIEKEHFGRCYWQMLSKNRTIMVELLDHPAANSTAVVIKHFDKPIPRSGSGKPWPEQIATYVCLPVDDSNTWSGLEKALQERAAARQPRTIMNEKTGKPVTRDEVAARFE